MWPRLINDVLLDVLSQESMPTADAKWSAKKLLCCSYGRALPAARGRKVKAAVPCTTLHRCRASSKNSVGVTILTREPLHLWVHYEYVHIHCIAYPSHAKITPVSTRKQLHLHSPVVWTQPTLTPKYCIEGKFGRFNIWRICLTMHLAVFEIGGLPHNYVDGMFENNSCIHSYYAYKAI